MNIVLRDARKVSQFSSIMKNLKSFSQDIELMVGKNGIYAQGMDSSHICLFELILKDDWFDEFEIEKSYTLGLNCELLAKVLNCLEQNQTIQMNYTEDKDNLFITLSPIEGESSIVKVFKLPLMDIESNLLVIPETEYTADIEMISEDFGKLIEQVSIFGKEILFELDEIIKVTGKGDNGTMNAIIKQDDILLYAIEEDTKLDLEFSGNYINMMTTFSKINNKIQIHFSKDTPMKIQYGLDNFMDNDDEDETEDTNFIRLFLAPKIND